MKTLHLFQKNKLSKFYQVKQTPFPSTCGTDDKFDCRGELLPY